MKSFIHHSCCYQVSQSVKEVIQGLVDDELVSSDRIGSSNYFWAFPSAALQKVIEYVCF